ncbi:hypothetical protein [Ruegeria lacuscaerulensis]|uniref:hypothetical protein n=1 Tax=Ruegeria lacuscaerulensis TaxID=55218 RepID=UPI00147AF736|nr:hypothetical protein [Ruegeria lacuscaerulensis]
MTWELSDELPDLSDALSGRTETDALLSEAIEDLRKVTALLDDTSITATERAEWAHIRSELVNELRRMVKRNLRSISN